MEAMAPGIIKGVEAWEPGPGFKVYDHIKKLTLDLAVDVFMGVELDEAERARINGAFIDAVRAGTAYVRFPVPGLRWHKGLQARKVLEEFFYRHLPASAATAATTCSPPSARPRPTTASGSPTRTSSTT